MKFNKSNKTQQNPTKNNKKQQKNYKHRNKQKTIKETYRDLISLKTRYKRNQCSKKE